MQKQGYRYSTVLNCIKSLRAIARRTNPSSKSWSKPTWLPLSSLRIRKTDSNKTWLDSTSTNRYHSGNHTMHALRSYPSIPSENEVDQLISGLGSKTACFLQLLRETGMRAGQAWNLNWIDLDTELRTLTVTPEKNSKPTQFKLSTKLIAMLNQLPRRSDQIFGGGNYNDFARWYYMRRRLLAKKLGNSRLRRISFKTFRHWKATNEYHRTRDYDTQYLISALRRVRGLTGYSAIAESAYCARVAFSRLEPSYLNSAMVRTPLVIWKIDYPIPAMRLHVCATAKVTMNPSATGSSADTAVHLRLPVSLWIV
jgi:hypothetical protein